MTKDEADDMVETVSGVDASETVCISGDPKRAVFGRALAHVCPQLKSWDTEADSGEWFVVIVTVDGARYYVHGANDVEVIG